MMSGLTILVVVACLAAVAVARPGDADASSRRASPNGAPAGILLLGAAFGPATAVPGDDQAGGPLSMSLGPGAGFGVLGTGSQVDSSGNVGTDAAIEPGPYVDGLLSLVTGVMHTNEVPVDLSGLSEIGPLPGVAADVSLSGAAKVRAGVYKGKSGSVQHVYTKPGHYTLAVPRGVVQATFGVRGGQGGRSLIDLIIYRQTCTKDGSYGGHLQASLPVDAGAKLDVYVGGTGHTRGPDPKYDPFGGGADSSLPGLQGGMGEDQPTERGRGGPGHGGGGGGAASAIYAPDGRFVVAGGGAGGGECRSNPTHARLVGQGEQSKGEYGGAGGGPSTPGEPNNHSSDAFKNLTGQGGDGSVIITFCPPGTKRINLPCQQS